MTQSFDFEIPYDVFTGLWFGKSIAYSPKGDFVVAAASKVALSHLVAVCLSNSIAVIDCQLPSPHLASLGSRTIPRRQFQALLREHLSLEPALLHVP